MCVAMVIIHTKTLEKKGVDDVTSKESALDLVRLKRRNRSIANDCFCNDTMRQRCMQLMSSFPSGNSSSCHDFTVTSRYDYKVFSLMEFIFLGKTQASGHRKWCHNCLHCLYCVRKKACFCNSLPQLHCNKCNCYRNCFYLMTGILEILIMWCFSLGHTNLTHYSLRLQAHPGKKQTRFPVSWKMRKLIKMCKQGSYTYCMMTESLKMLYF